MLLCPGARAESGGGLPAAPTEAHEKQLEATGRAFTATQGFVWVLHELQILPKDLCKSSVVCAIVLFLLLVLSQLSSVTQANSFNMDSSMSLETGVTAMSVEQSNPKGCTHLGFGVLVQLMNKKMS